MRRGHIELSGTASELLGQIGDIEDRYLAAAFLRAVRSVGLRSDQVVAQGYLHMSNIGVP